MPCPALPEVAERGIGLAAVARTFFLAAFDEAQHFADADRFRPARQQIAAFGAAARFDEAALLQAGEDQFQKFLGDFLAAGDVGDPDGLAGSLEARSKMACSAYSPLTEMFICVRPEAARAASTIPDCRTKRR